MKEKIKKYFQHLSAKNRGVSQEVINFVECYYNNPERFFFKGILHANNYAIGYEVGSLEEGFILANGLSNYIEFLRGKVGKLSRELSEKPNRDFSILIDIKEAQTYVFKNNWYIVEEINQGLDFLNEWELKYIKQYIVDPETEKQMLDFKYETLEKNLKNAIRERVELEHNRELFGERYEQ